MLHNLFTELSNSKNESKRNKVFSLYSNIINKMMGSSVGHSVEDFYKLYSDYAETHKKNGVINLSYVIIPMPKQIYNNTSSKAVARGRATGTSSDRKSRDRSLSKERAILQRNKSAMSRLSARIIGASSSEDTSASPPTFNPLGLAIDTSVPVEPSVVVDAAAENDVKVDFKPRTRPSIRALFPDAFSVSFATDENKSPDPSLISRVVGSITSKRPFASHETVRAAVPPTVMMNAEEDLIQKAIEEFLKSFKKHSEHSEPRVAVLSPPMDSGPKGYPLGGKDIVEEPKVVADARAGTCAVPIVEKFMPSLAADVGAGPKRPMPSARALFPDAFSVSFLQIQMMKTNPQILL